MAELALCARTPAEARIDVNALCARDERASANRVRLAGPACSWIRVILGGRRPQPEYAR
jgi:hypothetical protein